MARRASRRSPTKPVLAPPLAIAAVLLFSPRPERLAAFYRRRLGLSLRRLELPDLPLQYACEVGQVYFAVVRGARRPGASACVAFMVADVPLQYALLKAARVKCLDPPRRTSLGLIARFEDPDKNPFELYQP